MSFNKMVSEKAKELSGANTSVAAIQAIASVLGLSIKELLDLAKEFIRGSAINPVLTFVVSYITVDILSHIPNPLAENIEVFESRETPPAPGQFGPGIVTVVKRLVKPTIVSKEANEVILKTLTAVLGVEMGVNVVGAITAILRPGTDINAFKPPIQVYAPNYGGETVTLHSLLGELKALKQP